jgi:acetyl/propionyl-CoA carboxylase alpha subunit
MSFSPLHMLRKITEDHQLTTVHVAILAAAIVHTDNRTGRVRASQEMLAESAKTTTRTVRTFYRSEAFQRYFEAEHVGRRLNLTWLDTGSDTGRKPEATPEAASALLHLPSTSASSSRPIRDDYQTTEDWLLAVEAWELGSIGSILQAEL